MPPPEAMLQVKKKTDGFSELIQFFEQDFFSNLTGRRGNTDWRQPREKVWQFFRFRSTGERRMCPSTRDLVQPNDGDSTTGKLAIFTDGSILGVLVSGSCYMSNLRRDVSLCELL